MSPPPLRRAGALVLALALGAAVSSLTGCGGAVNGGGGGSGGTTQSASATASQASARAVAAADHFLDRYVAADGRVVRIDQGGDTVGEGQAYGMLMAAAIGDRKHFDQIWSWTQHNLQRPDRLLEFLWRDGHVVDPQAASDADLDASRALLVAACRFHQPALRAEAVRIGDAVLSNEVGSFRGQPVLTAGPWAISPKTVLDPSYFSPATYAALEAASRSSRWAALAASSLSIVSELMSGSSRLPPDWAEVRGDRVVAIGSPSETGARPEFGFDAVRTLVRLAEDPNPAGRRIAARAWPVFASQDPNRLPVQHSLSGRPIGDTLHPVVLVSAAGAADAAGQLDAREGLLDEAEALDRRSPTYYGAAWVALGRIMLTTNLLDACPEV